MRARGAGGPLRAAEEEVRAEPAATRRGSSLALAEALARTYRPGETDWLTIEVFDADTPATQWLRAWQDSLVETGIASGAVFWDDHEHAWGVVLEFAFDDEMARDRFREHVTVTAALDAAPDPVSGALVYPHRGGGTGSRVPRRPKPRLDSGAAAVEEPKAWEVVAVVGWAAPTWSSTFEVFA